MKTLVLLLLLAVTANCVEAQEPQCVWARQGQVPVGAWAKESSIAIDNSDNVFQAGYFAGTLTFGSYILTSSSNGAYLVKYDANGNIQWAKTQTGSPAYGQEVVTDKDGNAYLTGAFDGAVKFDSISITSSGNYRVFLVKFNPAGDVIWAKCTAGAGGAQPSGMTIDKAGNLYITGFFDSPSITIGSYTITTAASDAIFLAKFDSSGNAIWAKALPDHANSTGIATDSSANVYMTGNFFMNVIFGTDTLTTNDSSGVFVVKYDSSGVEKWSRTAGNQCRVLGYAIAAEASGNVYVTGSFVSPYLVFASDSVKRNGSINAFLVKFSSSGNVEWLKDIGSSAGCTGYCVACNNSDKVYISGAVYVGTLMLDTINLSTPTGATDPMFIAGIDTAGHGLFAKVFVGGGPYQSSVAVSGNINSSNENCVYLGAYFNNFYYIIDKDTLANNDGYDRPFVAKLCAASINSINESIKGDKFIIYPNPFKSYINIKLKDEAEHNMILMDITGRHLTQQKITSSAYVNAGDLAAGVYIVQIINKDGSVEVRKVVKQ